MCSFVLLSNGSKISEEIIITNPTPAVPENKAGGNTYTEAVDYLALYVHNTKPLFFRTAKRFRDVADRLDLALDILKSNQHYDGQNGPNP